MEGSGGSWGRFPPVNSSHPLARAKGPFVFYVFKAALSNVPGMQGVSIQEHRTLPIQWLIFAISVVPNPPEK